MTSDERVLRYVADANPIPDPHRMLDLRSFESVDLTEEGTRRRRVMQTVERELHEAPEAPKRRLRWSMALAVVVVIAAGVGSWLLLAGGEGDTAGLTEEQMFAAIETETALFEAGDWEGWSTFVDPAVYAEDQGYGPGDVTWKADMDWGHAFGYTITERECEVFEGWVVECIGVGTDRFFTPAGYSFEDIRVYDFNEDGAIVRISFLYTATTHLNSDLATNNVQSAYLRWLEEAYPEEFSALDVNTRILYVFPGWVEGLEGSYEQMISHVDEFLAQSEQYPVAPTVLEAPAQSETQRPPRD